MQTLEASLYQSLAYFDMFDYPLTAEELVRFLWQPPPGAHSAFAETLQALVRAGKIGEDNGFYFLPGREASVAARGQAVRHGEEKMAIARRAIRLIAWVPFVRAVFVTNKVAANCATAMSDIDILIVSRKGRLWLTRFFVLSLLGIARLRPTRESGANKICPCFFLTEEAFDLETVRMGEPDIYLAHWLCLLVPVYDPERLLTTIQEKNSWVRAYLPRGFAPYTLTTAFTVGQSRVKRMLRRFFERAWGGSYGNLLEHQAKGAQARRVRRYYGQPVPGTRDVVLNKGMLKFHKNDRRAHYLARWQERVREYCP